MESTALPGKLWLTYRTISRIIVGKPEADNMVQWFNSCVEDHTPSIYIVSNF